MNVKTKLTTVLSVGLLAFSMQTFADGALSLEKSVVVDSKMAKVWRTVGNFNGLDKWHPAVTKSEITKGENNVPEAERLLTLENDATISERLLAYSTQDQTYTYVILDSPFPIKNYKSTITVTAVDDGKTKIDWTSTFDAEGASDEKAMEVMTGVYEGGLNELKAQFD